MILFAVRCTEHIERIRKNVCIWTHLIGISQVYGNRGNAKLDTIATIISVLCGSFN